MSSDVVTRGKILLDLARTFPEGDPGRLYIEWLVANSTDHGSLRAAVRKLGLPEPPDGPGFSDRLEETVKPVLAAEYRRRH